MPISYLRDSEVQKNQAIRTTFEVGMNDVSRNKNRDKGETPFTKAYPRSRMSIVDFLQRVNRKDAQALASLLKLVSFKTRARTWKKRRSVDGKDENTLDSFPQINLADE